MTVEGALASVLRQLKALLHQLTSATTDSSAAVHSDQHVAHVTQPSLDSPAAIINKLKK